MFPLGLLGSGHLLFEGSSELPLPAKEMMIEDHQPLGFLTIDSNAFNAYVGTYITSSDHIIASNL